jgi:tetratricopeptide (TPR) repeat protein
MRQLLDSCVAVLISALIVSPVWAASPPAKKPLKHATPAAAAAADAPLDANDLIIQARQAQSHGDTELAVRLAQSAIVVSPNRSDTYDALADLYNAQHQPDYALSYYNEALSIDPADTVALKAIAGLDHSGSDQRAANTQGSQTGNP